VLGVESTGSPWIQVHGVHFCWLDQEHLWLFGHTDLVKVVDDPAYLLKDEIAPFLAASIQWASCELLFG
jgi:hypothetical protein